MLNKFKTSSRTKLAIILVTVSLVPIFVLSYFIGNTVKEHTKQDMINATTREISQIDNAFTLFLDSVKENTLYLANLPQIKNNVNSVTSYIDKKATSADGTIPMTPLQNSSGEAELYKTFLQYQASHPEVAAIFVGTEANGGFVQWPLSPRKAGYDARTRSWYKLAIENTGKAVITDPYVLSTGKDVVVSIVSAIPNENGKAAGVFGFDLSLNNLANMIKNIKIGQAGYVIMTDAKGTILAHPTKPELLNKNMKDIDADKFSNFSDIESGIYTLSLDGKDYILNVYTSEKLGWKYIAVFDETDFLASANQIQKTILLVSIIVLILAILISAFLAQRITRPLQSMIKGIDKDENGKITVKEMQVNSDDEIGELGQALNAFTGQIRQFIGEVARLADQTASSGNELREGAGRLAQNATQVSAAIAETAQSMQHQSDNISQAFITLESVQNNLKASLTTAIAADELAQTAAKDTCAGKTSVSTVVEQMQAINQKTEIASKTIAELGEQSKEIGQIVNAIANIAGQTNLLALNAAIEAARAGEQGRGFAVVAEEVRKLAEQSQEATKQIAALIGTIQADTDKAVKAIADGELEAKKGTEVVSYVGQSFNRIQENVEKFGSLSHSVMNLLNNLAKDNENINSMIKNIENASKNIASRAEEISLAIHEQSASTKDLAYSSDKLFRVAQELEESTSKFKL